MNYYCRRGRRGRQAYVIAAGHQTRASHRCAAPSKSASACQIAKAPTCKRHARAGRKSGGRFKAHAPRSASGGRDADRRPRRRADHLRRAGLCGTRSRIRARRHTGPAEAIRRAPPSRPPPDNGVERAAEIIAMQLTLAPADSRIVAAQELVEAQRKRVVTLEAALCAVQDSAGNARRGTKLPTTSRGRRCTRRAWIAGAPVAECDRAGGRARCHMVAQRPSEPL